MIAISQINIFSIARKAARINSFTVLHPQINQKLSDSRTIISDMVI